MKIMTKCTVDFRYNYQNIEIVNSYKYLGHVLNSHRVLHDKMPEYLVNQAQKALFALQSRIKPSLGYIPPSLAIKMFDSYIFCQSLNTIACYGVWVNNTMTWRNYKLDILKVC